MVVDRTGSLAGVTRHDYLPFGEEIQAGAGGRTTYQGYSQFNSNRKKWATYERDVETDLDYAQTRYYSTAQGRMTSPDKPFAGQYRANPQSWNMYQYVLNSPLVFIDPLGLAHLDPKTGQMVGDKEGETTDEGNFRWDAKKGQWMPTDTKPKKAEQKVHLEVIIWNQSLSLTGLGGHVSYNINGRSWSWENGGWHQQGFMDYLDHNSYRNGTGYVLGDENDPEWAESMANEITSFEGDGPTPVLGRIFGPYGLPQDNCGEAFCRAANKVGGANLPTNGGIAPVQHKAFIVNYMRPYIRGVNHYYRKVAPTPRVDRRGGYTGVGRSTW
jgi:RHS repeat-associated protein